MCRCDEASDVACHAVPCCPAFPLEHGSRWTAIPDGVVRDNCYNHTETVDERLASFGVTPQLPLYVAADWADVDPDREQQVGGACRTAWAGMPQAEALRGR